MLNKLFNTTIVCIWHIANNKIQKIGGKVREIKANFSITGEYISKLYLDDREAPNTESVNRSIIMQKIDRKLKEKGIEAFDFQMAIKVKEIDIDELLPEVESEVPF